MYRSSNVFSARCDGLTVLHTCVCACWVCRMTNSQTKQLQQRQAQMRPAEVAVQRNACRACVAPPTAASGCWSAGSSALNDRGAACGTAKHTPTQVQAPDWQLLCDRPNVTLLSTGRRPSWGCQTGEMGALAAPTQGPAAGCRVLCRQLLQGKGLTQTGPHRARMLDALTLAHPANETLRRHCSETCQQHLCCNTHHGIVCHTIVSSTAYQRNVHKQHSAAS